MPIYTWGGPPLLDGGVISISDACCCEGTPPAEGTPPCGTPPCGGGGTAEYTGTPTPPMDPGGEDADCCCWEDGNAPTYLTVVLTGNYTPPTAGCVEGTSYLVVRSGPDSCQWNSIDGTADIFFNAGLPCQWSVATWNEGIECCDAAPTTSQCPYGYHYDPTSGGCSNYVV